MLALDSSSSSPFATTALFAESGRVLAARALAVAEVGLCLPEPGRVVAEDARCETGSGLIFLNKDRRVADEGLGLPGDGGAFESVVTEFADAFDVKDSVVDASCKPSPGESGAFAHGPTK
jgi:hypothetical protein